MLGQRLDQNLLFSGCKHCVTLLPRRNDRHCDLALLAFNGPELQQDLVAWLVDFEVDQFAHILVVGLKRVEVLSFHFMLDVVVLLNEELVVQQYLEVEVGDYDQRLDFQLRVDAQIHHAFVEVLRQGESQNVFFVELADPLRLLLLIVLQTGDLLFGCCYFFGEVI